MTKADTIADLIFNCCCNECTAQNTFRTYLDLYADLRAMDHEKEAADRLFAGEVPDETPLLPIAPYPAPKAVPALELNDDNEYAVVQNEPADAQKKTPNNEHVFVGKGAAEKREIFDRLIAYKESHGPGCLVTLSKATGGKITDDRLRVMAGAGRVPLDYWLLLSKTLDKIAKEENTCPITANAPTAG